MKIRVSLRYFVSSCSLVLIYVLTFYRTKSSSILWKRYILHLLLTFFFWKSSTISSFQRLFCWKSRSSPNHVSLKFPSKIHSSQVIDCVSILPLPWKALSLVCVLSVFFYFSLSSFFLFQLVLSLTSTHIRKIGNIRKVSILQRIIAYCQESMPRWNFNINSKKLLENGN